MLAVPLPIAALAAAPRVFALAGPARGPGGILDADARVAGAVILLVVVAAVLFVVRRVSRGAGRASGVTAERVPGRKGTHR